MIKARDVITQVRKLAEQFPDAIYTCDTIQMCKYEKGYIQNGPPTCGCLIGQAIKAIDPDFDFSYYDANNIGILGIASEGRFVGHYFELVWLQSVQTLQDKSGTWSNCVKQADEFHKISETSED